DRPAPALLGAVGPARLPGGDAGVVVQDVEAAVVLLRRREHRVDAGGLRDIGVDGGRAPARRLDLLHGLGGAGVVHVGDDDVRPFARETQRRRAPDPRPRAGDDRRLPVDVHRQPFTPRARFAPIVADRAPRSTRAGATRK